MLCTECKVGNVLEDALGGETTLVCEECGCINVCRQSSPQKVRDEAKATHEKASKQVSAVANKSKFCKKSLKRYLKEIEDFVQQYTHKDDVLAIKAKDLFYEVVTKHCYYSQSNEKMRFAVACTFVVLREKGIPVNTKIICKMMGVPISGFQRCLHVVKQFSGYQLPDLNMDEVVCSLHLLPCVQNNEADMKKAVSIVNFLRQIALTDGRAPRKVAYLSAYLAIVSEEKMKRCTTLWRFCRNNNLTSDKGLSVVLNDFKERLCILVKRLPWTSDTQIHKHSFHFYIDDLLRYKDTLLNDCKEESSNGTDCHVISNPPSFVRPSEVKTYYSGNLPVASTSEIISEEDFPETELQAYIRTTDEIKELNNIKELLGNE